MGKLIKNHWARLIILTAAAYQVLAAICAFFWPKIFWDFLTTNLDHAVRPVPVLQIINLLLGLGAIALEWPLPLLRNASARASAHQLRQRSQNHNHQNDKSVHVSVSSASTSDIPLSLMTKILGGLHSSIEARLLIFPINSLVAFLIYQGTNAGFYYLIGMGVYFWAFSEGEVIMDTPWTLPRRSRKTMGHGLVSKV